MTSAEIDTSKTRHTSWIASILCVTTAVILLVIAYGLYFDSRVRYIADAAFFQGPGVEGFEIDMLMRELCNFPFSTAIAKTYLFRGVPENAVVGAGILYRNKGKAAEPLLSEAFTTRSDWARMIIAGMLIEFGRVDLVDQVCLGLTHPDSMYRAQAVETLLTARFHVSPDQLMGRLQPCMEQLDPAIRLRIVQVLETMEAGPSKARGQ